MPRKSLLTSRPWKSLPQILIHNGSAYTDSGCSNEAVDSHVGKYADTLKISREPAELPPPTRFKRNKSPQTSNHPKTCSLASHWTCVVSSSRPYKVVSISDELADLFMHSPKDVCGRGINILQGPSTDVQTLHAALKAADSRPLLATLYTSRGIELNLVLTCVAGADSTLSIHMHAAAQPWSTSECPPATDRALRLQYHKQYCFRAGLAIQQTKNRRGACIASAGTDLVD